MSFNLFIFERRENIKILIDINNYIEEFIKYEEEEDYNLFEGCFEIIVKFVKKMFEKFLLVNGKYLYLDEIVFILKNFEIYLIDYLLGKYGVFCVFDYLVVDEVISYIIFFVDEYKIGVYNL